MKTFTDIELFQMFNIELDATNTVIDEVRMPMWKVEPIEQVRCRATTTRIDGQDNIRAGVSLGECGSRRRVEDLAAFYADTVNEVAELSAFTV